MFIMQAMTYSLPLARVLSINLLRTQEWRLWYRHSRTSFRLSQRFVIPSRTRLSLDLFEDLSAQSRDEGTDGLSHFPYDIRAQFMLAMILQNEVTSSLSDNSHPCRVWKSAPVRRLFQAVLITLVASPAAVTRSSNKDFSPETWLRSDFRAPNLNKKKLPIGDHMAVSD